MQKHGRAYEPHLAPVTLSVVEAGNYIGVSTASMWRLLAEGAIPRIKLGRRTVIAIEDLQKLVTGARVKTKKGRH